MILFDEVEKAHPDVFNTLLQLLDDGRLTDSKGRTVDFKNTIIILTSNIGSDLIMDRLGDRLSDKTGDPDRDDLMSQLTKIAASKDQRPVTLEELMPLLQQHFRPEFLNRLDDIVVFNPVSSEMLHAIVDIQIQSFLTFLKTEKDITLTVSDPVKEMLGRQ